MIGASEIGEIIRNPELAGNYVPGDLAAIRDKFPYCSTLHLLYLKGLSLGNDLQFEEHLSFAAAHVSDRERMYYLIHSGQETTGTQQEPVPVVETEKNEPVQTRELTVEPVASETLLLHDTVELPVAENTPEVLQITETLTDSEITETVVPEAVPNILDAAPDLVEIAYTADLTTEEATYQQEIAIQEEKNLSEKTPIPEHQIEELQAEPDLSNLTFIEWLQYKQSKALPAKKTPNQAEEASKTEKEPVTSDELPKKVKKTGLSRTDVDALLNKFITEEPSISRPTATFFSPTKTAKQSLEEAPDLVTETLAKIYVLQKNYAKAIQAYEQLSLVYPEKKTFFATRIQKIKEDQHKQ